MRLALTAALGLALASPAFAETWDETLAAARGQTVYWNAWGGDERTNAFITWVGQETERLYDVRVEQVKLTDTAEAVTRVISEKAAGRDEGGSVDLIWINGANFLAMKEKGLLYGPFVADLPNAEFLDLSPGSAASVDFTVAVEGYESPCGSLSSSSPMTAPASKIRPATWPASSTGLRRTRAASPIRRRRTSWGRPSSSRR